VDEFVDVDGIRGNICLCSFGQTNRYAAFPVNVKGIQSIDEPCLLDMDDTDDDDEEEEEQQQQQVKTTAKARTRAQKNVSHIVPEPSLNDPIIRGLRQIMDTPNHACSLCHVEYVDEWFSYVPRNIGMQWYSYQERINGLKPCEKIVHCCLLC
jgi:hypothetical protein